VISITLAWNFLNVDVIHEFKCRSLFFWRYFTSALGQKLTL